MHCRVEVYDVGFGANPRALDNALNPKPWGVALGLPGAGATLQTINLSHGLGLRQ